MGSGQSKGEVETENRNNNVSAVPVSKASTRSDSDRHDYFSTTTTPVQSATLFPERDLGNTDIKSLHNGTSPTHNVKDSVRNKSQRNDLDFDKGSSNVEIADDVTGQSYGSKENQTSTKKHSQKVNVKRAENENLLEFLDSSDESDTDSILVLSDLKSKNKKLPKCEASAKTISLPLPGPPVNPNHSKVFQQEKALNEYNIQHGYNLLPSPKKNSVSEKIGPGGNRYTQKINRDPYATYEACNTVENVQSQNDDWDLEESIVQNFDAERYKAANAAKHQKEKEEQIQNECEGSGLMPKDDERPKRGKQNTPNYDDFDEELMAEIEREFEM